MFIPQAVPRCSDMSRAFRVHPKYLQKAKLAWKLKTHGREQYLEQELGRSLLIVIINLFLKGKPVNRVNFLVICQLLGLNWREMAGLDVPESQCNFPMLDIIPEDTLPNPSFEMGVGDVEEALNDLVSTLCKMLRRLTRKAGDLLSADRTSIFLVDQERKELGSLIAEDGSGGSLIIEMPLERGIAGLAATSLEVINIPFDLYDDPRSGEAKKTDQKTGYRTYTILAWPLLNQRKDLVAVVQLINKLKPNHHPKDNLLHRIDRKGFTPEDEALLAKFAPSILKILERCLFCYKLIHKLKKYPGQHPESIVRQNAMLIAKLRGQELKLRKSLAKI